MKNCKKAFTLAEVLITLAIIGVVATMTIPTLVADYQKKSWETSRDVFNRKLTEALKVMNSQGSLAGFRTTEDFVNELSKHLKITRVCSHDKLTDCFSEEVFWGAGTATPEAVDMTKIETSKNFGQEDWNTNIVGVQLANGTNALIAYNPTDTCKQDPYSNQITGESCLAILYDTSGFKSPNTSGKDLQANSNVKSLGGATCAFEIAGTCYQAPFYPEPHKWNACTTSGTSEDAEDKAFMAKYDLDYCMDSSYGTNDYWAGAVDACGGTDKMPTMEDLAALANELYGTTEITAYKDWTCQNSTSCRQDSSLGFANSTGSSSFFVWSGKEDSSSRAYYRGFNPTGAYYSGNYRDGSSQQAVCLGD